MVAPSTAAPSTLGWTGLATTGPRRCVRYHYDKALGGSDPGSSADPVDLPACADYCLNTDCQSAVFRITPRRCFRKDIADPVAFGLSTAFRSTVVELCGDCDDCAQTPRLRPVQLCWTLHVGYKIGGTTLGSQAGHTVASCIQRCKDSGQASPPYNECMHAWLRHSDGRCFRMATDGPPSLLHTGTDTAIVYYDTAEECAVRQNTTATTARPAAETSTAERLASTAAAPGQTTREGGTSAQQPVVVSATAASTAAPTEQPQQAPASTTVHPANQATSAPESATTMAERVASLTQGGAVTTAPALTTAAPRGEVARPDLCYAATYSADVAGPALSSTTASSPSVCASLCAAAASCTAAVLHHATSTCYLKGLADPLAAMVDSSAHSALVLCAMASTSGASDPTQALGGGSDDYICRVPGDEIVFRPTLGSVYTTDGTVVVEGGEVFLTECSDSTTSQLTSAEGQSSTRVATMTQDAMTDQTTSNSALSDGQTSTQEATTAKVAATDKTKTTDTMTESSAFQDSRTTVSWRSEASSSSSKGLALSVAGQWSSSTASITDTTPQSTATAAAAASQSYSTAVETGAAPQSTVSSDSTTPSPGTTATVGAGSHDGSSPTTSPTPQPNWSSSSSTEQEWFTSPESLGSQSSDASTTSSRPPPSQEISSETQTASQSTEALLSSESTTELGSSTEDGSTISTTDVHDGEGISSPSTEADASSSSTRGSAMSESSTAHMFSSSSAGQSASASHPSSEITSQTTSETVIGDRSKSSPTSTSEVDTSRGSFETKATEVTSGPTLACQVREALSDFANVSQANISAELVQQVLRGNLSGLEEMIQDLDPQPSPEDFERLREDLTPSLDPDIIDELNELIRALLSASTTTINSPSTTAQITAAISDFANLTDAEVPSYLATQLLSGNTSGLRDLISGLPSEPAKAELEQLEATLAPLLSPEALEELQRLSDELIPLGDEAVEALETFAAAPVPADVTRALAEGDQAGIAEWLEGLEPLPSQQSLKDLFDSPHLPQGIKESIGAWYDAQRAPTNEDPVDAAISEALQKFIGLNETQLPEDLVEQLQVGNVSRLESLIADLPNQPSKADLDELAHALTPLLSAEALGELTKLSDKLIPLDDAAVEAIEEYAGTGIPADVAQALASGDVEGTEAWLDSLSPAPSDAALAQLLASADVPDSVKAAIAAWAPGLKGTTTVDPAVLSRVREVVADFAGRDEEDLPPEIAAQLLAGDTGALEDLIRSLSDGPSKRDFEELQADLAEALSEEALERLAELAKASIPLDDATVSALEAFAGQPLPADVAHAFAGGDQGKVSYWLDSISREPSKAALADLLANDDVPQSIRDAADAWANPLIPPAEVDRAIARLNSVLPEDVPSDVVQQIKDGKPEALTEWMSGAGPMRPSDADWAAMGLPTLPDRIREELEGYKQAQKDLWELGKLADTLPDDFPAKVTAPLLASGDTRPLTAWMTSQGLKPSDDDWAEFEGSSDVSNGTRKALEAFKSRNCQGPFAGEWSQWTPCPVTCGRGNRTRTRERLQPDCPEVETLYCSLAFCEVDCSWGPWGSWGPCSQSCGAGASVRYRASATQPSHFGAPCRGPTQQTRNCSGKECVDPTMDPALVDSLSKAGIDEATTAEGAAFSQAAADTIPFLISDLTLEEKMALGHTLEATIPLCSYNGAACPPSDFKAFYDESLGNCFTFNAETPAAYMTERPGEQSGLILLLQSEQAEYLCTSQLGGFKLMVHNQTERPFADAEGFNVAPGQTTSVSMSQLGIFKQPPPYGECTMEKNDKFLYNGTHTLEGCLRSCYQEKLIGLTGCADPRYIVPPTAQPCPREKKLALDYYRNCRDESGGSNPMDCKRCTLPCNAYQYTLTTSTAEMVDSSLLGKICAVNGGSAAMAATCQSEASQRRNFALVKIYYERLNLIRHRELQDYQLTNLVSDFAGVLGITVGASVLTMLEFLYALADLAVHALSRQRLTLLAG